jgi:ABC-type multidrug transport system ATPase subunit
MIVMATHDFESAEGLLDVPICLDEGRLVAIGPEGGSLRQRYRRALEAGRP